MPDFEHLDQIRLLTRALWPFMPAPGRSPAAQGLYELGVRVHPELATKEVVVVGGKGFGGMRPGSLADAGWRDDALRMMQACAPELAGKIAAAATDKQKRELLASKPFDDLCTQFPAAVARAELLLSAADPEDSL